MSESTDRAAQARLGAPEVRRFLRDFVKRRVGDSDVDDVVQTVLLEALASTKVPAGDTDLRKWLVGVARHKIADLHRRNGREQPAELPDVETAPAPVEERELVRWVEDQTKNTKDADKTLDWMAREGEGDKLEHIAEEERLPAATVRQRVSRMRRWMKERWLAELAAVAALGLLAFVVWRFLLNRDPDQIAVPEPTPTAPPTVAPDATAPPVAPDPRVARGRDLRRTALDGACARGEGAPCLEQLDEAKRLDPAGDTAPEVVEARKKNEAVQNEAVQKENDAKLPVPTAVPSALPKAPPPKPTSTTPTVFPKAPTKGKPSFDPKLDKKSSSFELDGSDGAATGMPSMPQQATGSQSSDSPLQQALRESGKK